jgi:hypothetical protein
MNRTHTIPAALLALASFGCEARTLIGEVPDGSAPDGVTTTSPPPGADAGGTCNPVFAGDPTFAVPPELAGTWTGFIQGGSSLPSDAIKLVLDRAADGSGQIHVIYGTAAPPPPATSATELYPAGLSTMQVILASLFEGVPYAGHEVRFQPFGTQWRLTFSVAAYQGWESWCRLQTSYPTDDGHYNCVPGSGVTFVYGGQPDPVCIALNVGGVPGGQLEVSCAQATLCDFNHCTCDACGCAESSRATNSFDLLFDGDGASGGNVHLMRAAN